MAEFHIPVSACPILRDPPFAIALFWLAAAVGRVGLRALRAPLAEASRLERAVLAVAVGCGLLQYAPLALGLAGVLHPGALWAALGVLAILFSPSLARVARAAWSAVADRIRRPDWVLAAALLLLLPLLVSLLFALCPPTDPDGLGYHLAGPKRWLQAGRITYLPTLIQTNWPMGVEMLYTWALALWSDTAAKLIHWSLCIAALLAIYALGRRVGGRMLGVAAASVLLIAKVGILTVELAGSAYVDLGLTLEVTCAVLAYVLWRRGGAPGWLAAAALCAGFAASFKLTGYAVAPALAILTATDPRLRRRGFAVRLGQASAVLVIAVAPVLPWLLRTWALTGNPFYPQLSGLFATRDWSPAASAWFSDYFRHFNWAETRPLSLAQRKLLRLGALAVVAAAALLAAWRVRDPDRRALSVVCGVAALGALWATGLYARFFLPVLPLAAIALLLPVTRVLEERRAARLTLLALLAANALIVVRPYRADLPLAAAAATGRMDREAYLSSRLPVTPLWRYANAILPSDARILLVASGASYYSDRYCYTTQVPYQGLIPLDTFDRYRAAVQASGIGYLVVLEQTFHDDQPIPRLPPVRNEYPFARRLAETQGTLLYRTPVARLYALRW